MTLILYAIEVEYREYLKSKIDSRSRKWLIRMINSSQKYCSGNIHPYVLANKDEYGVALDNIEYSLSGIIEESNCNMFILEAV